MIPYNCIKNSYLKLELFTKDYFIYLKHNNVQANDYYQMEIIT